MPIPLTLTDEQVEHLLCVLEEERGRCLASISGLDGFPRDHYDVQFWKNELVLTDELLALLDDDDNLEPEDDE